MAKILMTGGAGFIGSHTALVLLDAGHELVVLDNYATAPQKPCGVLWSWPGPKPRAVYR